MVLTGIARELGQFLPPNLLEACRPLGNLAEPGTLFIVGGAVRDVLRGEQPSEVDLVIQGSAEGLAQRAVEFRLARRTAASQFMTVKLTIGENDIDVATARSESYPLAGALPDVSPADIETDLGRRDFTVNAIAASISPADFGRVIDPHHGVNDVRAGVLRALHPASFSDDGTRIIRAARYAARLRFTLHPDTEGWLRRDARQIITVGPDRLRNELNNLWQEPRPTDGLHLLHSWGVLNHLPTASQWMSGLYTISRTDREEAARPDDTAIADVYWALVATTVGDEYESLIEGFHLAGSSRRVVDDIRIWNSKGFGLFREAAASGRPSRIVDVLSHFSPAALEALYLTGDPEATKAIAKYLETWRHVRPELNGNDLLEMGIAQGPDIGVLLDRLRNDRLDGLVMDRDGERRLVRQWIARDSGASAGS